jgi:hypothetical protein
MIWVLIYFQEFWFFKIWFDICWSKKYGTSRNYSDCCKEEILVKPVEWSQVCWITPNILRQKVYNTPPVFRFTHHYWPWLKNLGGIAAIEK